jgi:hypothetical protein
MLSAPSGSASTESGTERLLRTPSGGRCWRRSSPALSAATCSSWRRANASPAYVRLMEAARAGGWTIVSADGSIDLTTPHGRAMANMAAVFAELERDLIGERTRVALKVARRSRYTDHLELSEPRAATPDLPRP